MFTNVHELQTKREIIDPQRFLYSKATMEPDANIKTKDKLHAEFKADYRTALQDRMLSHECKKVFEKGLNFHMNKKHKTTK